MSVLKSLPLFALAALFEIGGAWLVWQGVREHRGWVWAGAGVIALGLYGFVATLQPDPNFGRILAAYGGVFVAGSLAWAMVADKFRPDRWDITGAVICLVGVAVIMYAPGRDAAEAAPSTVGQTRFTIVPDDFRVPYAGIGEDGRPFFLSRDLNDATTSYVGLIRWHADGTPDQISVEPISGDNADELIAARLADLGAYDRSPIEVEPFTRMIDAVRFGFEVTEFEGEVSIDLQPGRAISYHAPWDGLDYS